MAATRSNCATLTRPQFRPPTTRSTAAITSNVFIFSSVYLVLGQKRGIDHVDHSVTSQKIRLHDLASLTTVFDCGLARRCINYREQCFAQYEKLQQSEIHVSTSQNSAEFLYWREKR